MKKLLILLITAALLMTACGADEVGGAGDAVGETDDIGGGETAETSAEAVTEPVTEPLWQPEYLASPETADFDEATLMSLNIYAIQLYGQVVEGEPVIKAKYTSGSREVMVCDVTLAGGAAVCLEFDANVSNNGIIIVNEGTDAQGCAVRSGLYVGEVIAVGDAADCPYTDEDYDGYAAKLAGALFGGEASATAVDSEIIGVRRLLVYDVTGGTGDGRIAFDGWLHNAAVNDGGEWLVIENADSSAPSKGGAVPATIQLG